VVWDQELSDAQRADVATLLHDINARVQAWAAIATRHHPSQLTRLNEHSGYEVRVGPTIASLLSWAADAWELTGGASQHHHAERADGSREREATREQGCA
jgi:thiamine biosynthesis lipoprotein ApbE